MGNEVRLIDAKFAQHIANKELNSDESGVVQWVLSHTPTIDPESLRPKGRWWKRGNEKKCSVCKFIYYSNNDDFNYCPNCGAKMEG